ncbi:unnamed protein product [Schistosoma curassoni]|uniref:Uncharacterized protein n=1 Tax=Schistosoma curassoni TaxID=6186 RepID=A0A183K1L7_9TREM|nr:unnamed protein product [Schistosoma curassoni]
MALCNCTRSILIILFLSTRLFILFPSWTTCISIV